MVEWSDAHVVADKDLFCLRICIRTLFKVRSGRTGERQRAVVSGVRVLPPS